MVTSFSLCKCQTLQITLLLKYRWDQEDAKWSIGDGVVQDTSGDVIFTVPFKAITCLPEVNEVLDGKVIEVTGSGITVQSGSIKCFV